LGCFGSFFVYLVSVPMANIDENHLIFAIGTDAKCSEMIENNPRLSLDLSSRES